MPLDAAIQHLPAVRVTPAGKPAARSPDPAPPRGADRADIGCASPGPTILVMLAQASTGLIETWWVSRLGIDALAGMALVFSRLHDDADAVAGAMGGGISSAIARALGGRPARRFRTHSCSTRSSSMLRSAACFPRWCSGSGRHSIAGSAAPAPTLDAALVYSNIVFLGTPAGVADECAGERRPRHRQHAGAVARDLCRGRHPGASCRPA